MGGARTPCYLFAMLFGTSFPSEISPLCRSAASVGDVVCPRALVGSSSAQCVVAALFSFPQVCSPFCPRVCFLHLLQYRHRIVAASFWSRSFGRELVRRGVHLLLRLGTLFRHDDDGRPRLLLRDLPLLYERSPLLRLPV